MNNKHTGPYVPEAMYACHRCSDPTHPARLYWMDLSEVWLCDHCLHDLEEPIHRSTPCLADHLKSLEPRWVPVSERLPEFEEGGIWVGFAWYNRKILAWSWGRVMFSDGGITHWLDFTPPPLPVEEVGG